MKCPRCGLFNPDIAGRCDCGYDFTTKTVEKAYFEQKLPNVIKTFFIVLILANGLNTIASLRSENSYWITFNLLWTVIVYPLYLQMTRRKAWARYALMGPCSTNRYHSAAFARS